MNNKAQTNRGDKGGARIPLQYRVFATHIGVDTKCVPMPTHLEVLQDRVKQEFSRFSKSQQAGLDENESRRASQFCPVIDKKNETSNCRNCRFVPRQFQYIRL
jgi:hypothetical protein